jgi:Omp85 superfamily domain
LFSVILIINAAAQESDKDYFLGYTNVIADSELQASSFVRFFLGDHWRDVWTTSVKLPILDLTKFAGGLTPTKLGGGQQTKSLHFIGKDGKKYKFRSLKKDAGRSLPADFQNSVVNDFIQDQVSVINPVSAIVIPDLMQAVNILHVKPILCVLPDSDLLGEFKEEFGGTPGTIEENPDEYENTKLNFAGADKVVGTFKLFEKLEEVPNEQVDQTEYLKARLLDILIGDRDRHAGQWDWAGYKVGDKRIWKPIPKDRDFAFPLYDGLIPRSLTIAITSMVNFGDEMPSMLDMTWEGRHLDRRFLGTLKKEMWDSVADYMQNHITNEVIEKAVFNLPPEYFKIAGQTLISKLKSRRDQLKKACEEYYQLVVMYVDLYGTNKDEYIEVTRLNDQQTKYELFEKESKTGEKNLPPIKSGILDNKFTDELRVHLLDGDDYAIIRGQVNNGIRVVVDAGEGRNILVDSSNVSGNLLHILPIEISLKKTEFYDSGKKTKVIKSSATYFNDNKYEIPNDPLLKYEPKIEDRYHDYGVIVPVEYNNDDGLFLGFGGRINYYDFRQVPYDHKFEAVYGYAYNIHKHYVHLLGEFNDLIENTNVTIPFTYSGLEITRFYGFGNVTVLNKDSLSKKYYNINQKLATISFTAKVPFNSKFNLLVGGSYKFSNIVKRGNELINVLNPYGVGELNLMSVEAGLLYDNRNNIDNPTSGNLFSIAVNYFPKIFNVKSDFEKLKMEIRHYQTFNYITSITFAGRLLGEYVLGNYPFFEGASIGGKKTFRGFSHGRFVGDGSIVGEFDIRMLLGKYNLLVPSNIGFNFLTDLGRVFFKNEISERWHGSFGCGIWMSVYDNSFVCSINFVKSSETYRIYFTLGQMF